MSERDESYRTGLDRMDHPLSHTAAVVAGVAFVVLTGCAAMLLSDRSMLRSTSWWSAFVLAGSVMAACVVGYFRPRSRAIYVPIVLAGVVTLFLCLLHGWFVFDPATKVHPAKAFIQSVVFFGSWVAWACGTARRLRVARQTG